MAGKERTARPRMRRDWLAIIAFELTLYTPFAVAAQFLSIFVVDRGVPLAESGVVVAVPLAFTITLALTVGRLSDRAPDLKAAIVAICLASALAAPFLDRAHGFAACAALWALVAVPSFVLSPVADAAIFAWCRRHGRDYGSARVFGSLGFIAALLVAGQLADRFGTAAFVPLLVAITILRTMAALALPRFRVPGPLLASPVVVVGVQKPRLRDMMTPWFLLVVLGSALLQAGHHVVNGIGAKLWEAEGISPATISVLLAIAPAAEVAAFGCSGWVLARVSARWLLGFAAAAGVVRWSLTALTIDPVALGALQALHFATFGIAFVSALVFIGRNARAEMAAEAQSFLATANQALAAATLAVSGALAGPLGSGVYWLPAALCVGSVLAIGASLAIQPVPARHRGPGEPRL